MRLRKTVSLLLLFAVILLLLPYSSFANEESPELDKFLGTYRGSYYANQGHTGLSLKVYMDEDMSYKARFNFYSVPENPNVPSGEYICDVKYDEGEDQYIIIGKEWINRPGGYVFVDLYGKYERLSYSGSVDSRYGGKFSFDLVKQVEENEPSEWADGTIDSAVMEGIIPLELQGNYKDAITRAEFTRIMIATISKYEERDMEEVLNIRDIELDKNVFTDTEDTFVLAAYNLKIIEGYGNGIFRPDDLLTREQAAKMLRSMLDLLGIKNTTGEKIAFQDENTFSTWARDHIEFITSCHIDKLDKAIMEGVGANFNPSGKYTREQSYLTVYRLLEYAEQEYLSN